MVMDFWQNNLIKILWKYDTCFLIPFYSFRHKEVDLLASTKLLFFSTQTSAETDGEFPNPPSKSGLSVIQQMLYMCYNKTIVSWSVPIYITDDWLLRPPPTLFIIGSIYVHCGRPSNSCVRKLSGGTRHVIFDAIVHDFSNNISSVFKIGIQDVDIY